MRGVLDFGPTVLHMHFDFCLPSSLFSQLSCPDSHAKTQTVASSAGKWPLFHTHICTHRDAENKSILHVLLPACQLAARLFVQSHAKSLMRLGPQVRMKGMGKGMQSPSHCKRNISENHISKVPSCSGR